MVDQKCPFSNGAYESWVSLTLYAPASFDGRRFRNNSGRAPRGMADGLLWLLTRPHLVWPDKVANIAAPKPVAHVGDGSIRATVVGHATVLLQVAGLNILTDPVWSKRIGPLSWLGVKRVRPPAIAFEDLPKIHTVLLSHDHYDHLDWPTLARLSRRDAPLVVTGRKVGRAIPSARAIELDWWESYALGDHVRVTYVPAEHFSGRGLFDRNASLWGGFVLETPAGSIYFAGDTGDGPHFTAIRERLGPMTLSLIPIGAYAPRWFMAPVHINPAEAVKASLILESQVSLAIHYGTFRLADDTFEAPPLELAQALSAAHGANRGLDFRLSPFGEPVVVCDDRMGAQSVEPPLATNGIF
jgi:L-ascorbate metabolism protein UlaG (beta-lactamase superfamily)